MAKRDIGKELDLMHEKLDRILDLLQKREGKAAALKERQRQKQKPPALTEEEMHKLQDRFASLYERWLSGDEHAVQDELESLDADELRRFADANNLNVTSKMPKQKVLQLIGARFREKRQLHRGSSLRGKDSS